MLRLALAGLVLTTTALAQEPPAKPAQPQPGRIAGTVVTDGGALVAGATVFIASPLSNTNLSLREAVSDSSGAFEFPEVPPGTHRLTVSKPGLLQAGGSGTANGGRSVTVRAGEHVKDATLTLTRAGVITGRIIDEFGEPVDQLEVYAMRSVQGVDGRPTLRPAGDADLTDDRGEFRLFGLPPGEYVVMAVTMRKPDPANYPRSPGPLGPFETLPTYFPGTHDVAEARPVVLDTGQEMSAGFTWRPARPFRVSGVIVSARSLMPPMISLGTPNMTAPPVLGAANGSFLIEGVGPGDYTLSVRSARDPVTSVPVSVRDADVTGLVITMMPPVMIRGRVTFEGARPPETLSLRLMERDGADFSSIIVGDVVEIQPDGQFAAESAASHVFVEAPSGWSLTGLTIDGTDAFASGIDLSGRTSVDNVRVTLTDKLTQVSGRVTSDRGEPLPGGMVLLLQLDAGSAPLRSIMRTLQTDAGGRFDVRGLRRGSYVAAAIDVSEPSGTPAEFLDRLRAVGQRFSLEDGQTVTLDLKPSEALR